MAEVGESTPGLVSVILPVHNGEQYLREAVECVLRQAYRPLEIIIVDDGSTDGTAEVARAFGSQVRFLRQDNAGPAAARNLGIRAAGGEFVAFIDADDVWPDDKLRLQMLCFAEHPSTEVVQGLIRRVWLPPAVPPRNVGTTMDAAFFYTNLGSMIMRRSVFGKVGYFDESLAFHEDSDLWLRARERGVEIRLQRRLGLLYRIHGRNLTTGADVRTTGFLSIIRRSLHRRRGGELRLAGARTLPLLLDCEAAGRDHVERGNLTPTELPLVTVVVYGMGSPESLKRAFASLEAQRYQRLEVLVLGSELEIALEQMQVSAKISSALQDHSDLASGLNAAQQVAKGELIAFLHAEAAWSPAKLRVQVAYLTAHPRQGYVAGVGRPVVHPLKEYPVELIEALSVRGRFGDLLDTLLIRRSTLDDVGGFRPGIPGMEATDWMLRAMDRGFSRYRLPAAATYQLVQTHPRVAAAEDVSAALMESVRASVHRKRSTRGPESHGGPRQTV
jgi:glycosyltransferase involved in cell wall biosynthesis